MLCYVMFLYYYLFESGNGILSDDSATMTRQHTNMVITHTSNTPIHIKYCEVFGRMPSLLGNLKLDTTVVARQPKVKHFHGYADHSVLSRCMVA
jgi:hypothetical protein